MKDSFSNWFFHVAVAIGAGVYVLIKPHKTWWLNIVKFIVGYCCALFTSNLVLSVFQYFFAFSQETFDQYLPAVGFINGVLGMTFFEALVRWMRGDMGGLLTDIIKSWLERKK